MSSDPPPADSFISAPSSLAYWSEVPSTVDGMLGGYPQISRIDLRGSRNFVAKLRRPTSGAHPTPVSVLLPRGVDCGAGIGRVTAGFMSHVCQMVDIVEPISKFAAEAGALTEEALGPGRIGKLYVMGLEDWMPGSDGARYDLIWNQWCLTYLPDAVLVAYLERCKAALAEGGWVVVKENVTTGGGDVYDDLDSAVTRTEESWRRCFENAGWQVVRSEQQKGFPQQLKLHPVKFWALQPK